MFDNYLYAANQFVFRNELIGDGLKNRF